MSQLVGADPAALQEASDTLRSEADRLLQIQESTSAFVVSLAWEGAVAEDFLTVWSFAHGPKFAEAATFLTHASHILARSAAEQRIASSANDPATNDPSSPRYRQALADRLTSAGFALGAVEMNMLLKIGNQEFIDWFADNANAFKNLSKVAGGGSLLSDFLADAVQHTSLPADERIVHAIGETAMRYAADKGISYASQWAGMALAGFFTAGIGVLAGRAIGWVVGELSGAAFEALDDNYEVTEKGADLITDAYRVIRDNPDPYLRAVPLVGPAIVEAPQTWDLVTNVVPTIEEFSGNLTDATYDSRERVGHLVGDVLDTTAEILLYPQLPKPSTW